MKKSKNKENQNKMEGKSVGFDNVRIEVNNKRNGPKNLLRLRGCHNPWDSGVGFYIPILSAKSTSLSIQIILRYFAFFSIQKYFRTNPT